MEPESQARGTPRRRRWIKLHCQGVLHGSINYQLTPEEQMIWIKLLALAGDIGREGQISDNDGRPFPSAHLAHELHTTEEVLKSTIDKCIDEGRLSENEHGLHITNWTVYQSEYERQKPYRKGDKNRTHTYKKCPVCKWKGLTDKDYCPNCAAKGKETELEKDYKGGKYGHMVK